MLRAGLSVVGRGLAASQAAQQRCCGRQGVVPLLGPGPCGNLRISVSGGGAAAGLRLRASHALRLACTVRLVLVLCIACFFSQQPLIISRISRVDRVESAV
eukprot:COSAG01_NODE_256_length_20138_cov_24.233694_3_plen_101_part_00